MIIPYPGPTRHPVSVAGEFKTCTILFSDVVTFTNICAACQPIQIVTMLNSMYSKFDRLTSVHEVYKVGVHGLRGGRPGGQELSSAPPSRPLCAQGLVQSSRASP